MLAGPLDARARDRGDAPPGPGVSDDPADAVAGPVAGRLGARPPHADVSPPSAARGSALMLVSGPAAVMLFGMALGSLALLQRRQRLPHVPAEAPPGAHSAAHSVAQSLAHSPAHSPANSLAHSLAQSPVPPAARAEPFRPAAASPPRR